MGNTIHDLVTDLNEKLKTEKVEARAGTVRKIIRAAERGHYHDFMTEAATPKVMLYHLMTDLGYSDIADKVKSGGYDDESPEDTLPGTN